MIRSQKPDVVLLDTNLPKLNGIDAAKIVSERNQHTKILFLSADGSADNVLEALSAGANGFILKDCEKCDLLCAIKSLAAGHAYLSPAITANIISEYVKLAKQHEPVSNEVCLTLRERQVLQLVCEGQTNKEIADVLSVCVKTVEKHRASMKRKLNVSSTEELINVWNQQSQAATASNIRQLSTAASREQYSRAAVERSNAANDR